MGSLTKAGGRKYYHSAVLKRTENRAGASKSLMAGALIFGFVGNPTIGAFTWLNCRKAIVKQEVKRHIIAGIKKDNLVLFEFSRKETQTLLRWEHSREFEYNHQMYDVVETWTLGDTIYYWCWWDHEETKLNARIREMAARAAGTAPQLGEMNESLPSSLKSLSGAAFCDCGISRPEGQNIKYCSFSDLYSSIVIEPVTPPPRPA